MCANVGVQVFVFGLSLEIMLRLYAEGPSDFWTFYRLSHNEGAIQGSYRAEALRFDVVVTLTALLGYILFKAVGVVRVSGGRRVALGARRRPY